MTSSITLVFTDVVGSSAAKRDINLGSNVSLRDHAYLEAIQSKHLRLVRSAVAEHKGTEIMTIGDSFFLTFEEPLDALRCCAAIQQRLKDQPIDTLHGPLRLRMGIHTGAPEFFEGSWHGTDVDSASRVQSAASARQIIVSHAARQLLGEPIGIKFRPLGDFALKGVGNVKLWDADYDYFGLRPAAIPSNQQKRRRRMIAASATALVLLPILLLGMWMMWQEHNRQSVATAPAPSGPASSIIVAEFENKTGESVFDSVLTPAFTIQLQQSAVLTIVNAEHLHQSMVYLGKAPNTPLTPEIAREIGVREGIKAYLTGAITKLGNAYLINVYAVNTANGDSIASGEAQAADKDHILEALSEVASVMRNKLGESLDSIQKLDTPLGQATTPSLEAFRAYALGDADHDAGRDFPDAEGHYKQALEIDPNFAMAWARLGAAYSNSGQDGKAQDCFTKAFQLSKNVSAREHYYIDGFYYKDVTGDLQKAADVLDLACRTYPREKGFLVNLSLTQNQLGRVEEALATSQKAHELSPSSAIVNNDLLFNLLELDRLQECQDEMTRIKKQGLKDTDDIASFYTLHAFMGDAVAMAQDVASTQGREDENIMMGSVALMDEYFGKYADAKRMSEKISAFARQHQAKDTEAFSILIRNTGRAQALLPVDAAQVAHDVLALDQSRLNLGVLALLEATCNRPDLANPAMVRLAHDYPEDTMIEKEFLPECHAWLHLFAHQPQAALQDMEGGEPFDLVSINPYLRGLAFLDLHDGPGAVAAFKKATLYRGATILNFSQDYGQAQLGLARAYMLTKDKASAMKAYEALFAMWKDADADLPQLVAAKKEYAALK